MVGQSWEGCSQYSWLESLGRDVHGIADWPFCGEIVTVKLIGESWEESSRYTRLNILGKDSHGKVAWAFLEECLLCSCMKVLRYIWLDILGRISRYSWLDILGRDVHGIVGLTIFGGLFAV